MSIHNRYMKVTPAVYNELLELNRLGLYKCNFKDIFKRTYRLKPYGLKHRIGYGGEQYFQAYGLEDIFPFTNKGGYRRNIKSQLKSKLLDEDFYINMRNF